MKEETKPSSNLAEKFMDSNKSDLPKGSFPKIVAAEKNFLNTELKADSPLLKKIDPDKKRVEELSAKELENRRKFKEKLNKLKKMPMSPQPTINVNSEGLTEGELTIENMRRKFKQIFSKYFKESLPSATPEIEKTIEKKQANVIGTKPVNTTIYRFGCVMPIKRNASSAGKDIESMICKSVGLLPEQFIDNDQILLFSKDKQKFVNTRSTGSNDNTEMTKGKISASNDNTKITGGKISGSNDNTSEIATGKIPLPTLPPGFKVLETNENLKHKIATKPAPASKSPSPSPSTSASQSPSPTPKQALPTTPAPSPQFNEDRIMLSKKEREKIMNLSKPTIDLAPDIKPKSNLKEMSAEPDKTPKLLIKGKFNVTEKTEEIAPKPPMEKTPTPASVSGGILSRMLKNFSLFKPKSWFSGKSKETKMKNIPFPAISKIPLRWRHGIVILGTFIPLFYTYHKIVTNNELTFELAQEKN